MVKLGELMRKTKSIDPRKSPEILFQLFSIPAYDNGYPELIRGKEVGSSKTILQDSDVVLSKIVPHIRRTWVIPRGDNRIGSSEWIVFNDTRFDPIFVAEYLKSDVFHRQLLTTVAGVGGSLNRARPAAVADLKIPLPPLNEQKRIAEILGGVAETLELLQKQIDWVERVLKSNLQDDTEKTQEVLLSDFVTRISAGKSMPDGDMKKPKYQVLKTSAVTSGFFKETEAKGLPEGYIPPLTHKVHAGDILVSRMNTTELVGASAIVESVSENIYLPDRLWKLHPVEGTDPFFLWQLLQTRLIRARISQVSSGSSGSMKNISQKAFLNIKVPFASSSEQSKISKTIRSLLHLRQLLHQKLTLLQELQRSLSARAFAGQL